MRYLGSKNRFKKELIPIIQSYIKKDTVAYIEPFVGGANVIDKIKHHNKIGYDIHEYLIALLKHIQTTTDDLPKTILLDEYKRVYKNYKESNETYAKWYVGLVGFCATFGSMWFASYGRKHKDDINGENVAAAIKNLKKQAPNLKHIKFINDSYLNIDISKINNCVIYCDPPYYNTATYKGTIPFDYEEFYLWCKKVSLNNTVLISSYELPDEFKCIWEKETKINLCSSRKKEDDKNKRIEKLFIC